MKYYIQTNNKLTKDPWFDLALQLNCASDPDITVIVGWLTDTIISWFSSGEGVLGPIKSFKKLDNLPKHLRLKLNNHFFIINKSN